MVKIINKVPHPVYVLGENNEVVKKFSKSNGMIRLRQHTAVYGELNGLPISRTTFGSPEGLPEFKEGVYYIVSHLVKTELPNRTDLLVPAQIVRDEEGTIIGCKSLDL